MILGTSCGLLLNEYDYKITKEYVMSRNNESIIFFSIAIHERDSLMKEVRPINHIELARYCCMFKGTGEITSKVYFNNKNDGYYWSRCDLCLHFV